MGPRAHSFTAPSLGFLIVSGTDSPRAAARPPGITRRHAGRPGPRAAVCAERVLAGSHLLSQGTPPPPAPEAGRASLRHALTRCPEPRFRTSGPTGLLGWTRTAFDPNPNPAAPHPPKGTGSGPRGARLKSLGGALGEMQWGYRGSPRARPGSPPSLEDALGHGPLPRSGHLLPGAGRPSQGLRVPPGSHGRPGRRRRGGPGGLPGARPASSAQPAAPGCVPSHPAAPRHPSPPPAGSAEHCTHIRGWVFALMRNVINPEKRAESRESRRGRGGGRRATGAGGTESFRLQEKSPESAGPAARRGASHPYVTHAPCPSTGPCTAG